MGASATSNSTKQRQPKCGESKGNLFDDQNETSRAARTTRSRAIHASRLQARNGRNCEGKRLESHCRKGSCSQSKRPQETVKRHNTDEAYCEITKKIFRFVCK